MRFFLPVIISLALIPMLSGDETESSSMPTILTKSPFLPPDFQPPGTPGKATTPPRGKQKYEFRGVYELGGVYYYNLYSATEKKGNWITEKNAGDMGFTIVDFDPDKDSLELVVDGEPMNLSLIETSDKPMALTSGNRPTSARKPSASKKSQRQARRRVIRPTASKQSKSSSSQRRIVGKPPSTP